MCATFLHTSPLFLHTHFNILFVMAYKKNPKKKDALSIKRAVESLRFQIDWGLKLLGAEKGDLFHQLAKVEVDFISELNLTQDILAIKSLVDGVKQKVLETAREYDRMLYHTRLSLKFNEPAGQVKWLFYCPTSSPNILNRISHIIVP